MPRKPRKPRKPICELVTTAAAPHLLYMSSTNQVWLRRGFGTAAAICVGTLGDALRLPQGRIRQEWCELIVAYGEVELRQRIRRGLSS